MGKFAVSEAVFQNTMRFIFGFISKERQAENIVEKLCQRFKLADEPRQWRDIAYCLSLLPFRSEKSMRILVQDLPHYKDKLHDKGVYERFQEILGKAKLAKKAALQGVHSHSSRKPRFSVSFHRPKTLRLPREPKYPRKSVPHAPRMDQFRTIVR